MHLYQMRAYAHVCACTNTYAFYMCKHTCKAPITTHTHTHTLMHAMQNIHDIHTQTHNVLNVCARVLHVLPSVSYDRREFIDGELVFLPELKPTQHLLPKSMKDSENRQLFYLCLSVAHVYKHTTFIRKCSKSKSCAVSYILR